MVDYKKDTGSNGQMMIRDTGTYVEFWLKATSETYNYRLPWGYKINGKTDTSNLFNFTDSGDWQRLGRWSVTSDQSVTFYLYDSGTVGLGGPTTLTASINRTSVPDAPYAPRFYSITGTSVRIDFTDRDNNGSPIDARQISYSSSSSAVGVIVSSDGSTTITGLTPKKNYYAKARTHNAKGWSEWSSITSFKTPATPSAPSMVRTTAATQTTVLVQYTPGSDGGSPIIEREFAVGKDPNTPQTFLSGTVTSTKLINLSPATRHYIWARERNAVGWGPYSPRATFVTKSSVKVVVFNTWVLGSVYVRHNGVWKQAIPMIKIAGMWKETE